MVIRSTQFEQKDIYKGTWMAPNGETVNQIDHILIEEQHAKCISKIRSYRGADADSDHFLVRATLNQGIKIDKPRKSKREPVYDLTDLQNENKQRLFEDEMEKQLSNSENTETIPEHWKQIEDAINTTIKATLKRKKRNNEKNWYDEDCKEAVENRKKAREKVIKDNREENKKEYKEARKKAKQICRTKKRTYNENRISVIEEKYKNKEIRNF